MAGRVWYIRSLGEVFDASEVYGNNPTLFSLKVHHGGKFTKFPERTYVEGQVRYVDLMDSDEFSVHQVSDVVKELGYSKKEIMFYHYKVPGMDLNFGLRALGNDADVLGFLQYVDVHKLMEVYIEHRKTEVETYFFSPNSTKVVIEELDDDAPGPSRPVRSSQEITNACRRRLALEWQIENVVEPNESVTNTEMGGTDDGHLTQSQVDQVHDGVVTQDGGGVFDAPDMDNMFESNNDENASDGGEGEELDHDEPTSEEEGFNSDDEDSDYIVDSENDIDDMDEFASFVDMDIEDGLEQYVEDVQHTYEVDIDEFDSMTDEENDTPLQKTLRRERRKKNNNRDPVAEPFYVGQAFTNRNDIRALVKTLAVDSRRQLKIVRNDPCRFRVVCEGSMPEFTSGGTEGGNNVTLESSSAKKVGGSKKATLLPKKSRYFKPTCPWLLHVSNLNKDGTWIVKTFINDHNCFQTRDVGLCTVSWLAQEFESTVLVNPNVPLNALQDLIHQKYQI